MPDEKKLKYISGEYVICIQMDEHWYNMHSESENKILFRNDFHISHWSFFDVLHYSVYIYIYLLCEIILLFTINNIHICDFSRLKRA